MADFDAEVQAAYEKIIEFLRDELTRHAASSTQEELAELCGVSQPTINRILKSERGRDLPLKTVLKIVLALRLDLAALLSPDPKTDKDKLKALVDQINKLIA